MNKNIVLCGVGGQGTVLASKLIAAAAMKKGLSVMNAETIGMAQRGGSVFSHVRIGDDVCSPMIARGSADLIVGFEPGEAVRMLPFLKEGGQVVTSSRAILPVTAYLSGSSYNGEDMVSYLKSHVENVTCAANATAVPLRMTKKTNSPSRYSTSPRNSPAHLTTSSTSCRHAARTT